MGARHALCPLFLAGVCGECMGTGFAFSPAILAWVWDVCLRVLVVPIPCHSLLRCLVFVFGYSF